MEKNNFKTERKNAKISGQKKKKDYKLYSEKGGILSVSCKFIIPFVEKKFPKDVENYVENVKKPLEIPLFQVYPNVEKSASIRC